MVGGTARTRLRSSILRTPYTWWRHRGVAETDTFLASYPKSGNTWMKFMLGRLLARVDVDFEQAERLMPSVGHHAGAPRILPGGARLLKTHERFRTEYRRAIYMVRDGRDVAVSYYYHQLRHGRFSGPFDGFFDAFLKGRVDGYGCWHDQVLSWLDSPLSGTDQLRVVQYEALRADPAGTLSAIAQWLGLDVTHDDVNDAVEANTMSRMRAKEQVTAQAFDPLRTAIPVVRTGGSGEWRTLLDPARQRTFTRLAGDVLARLGYEAT